MKKNSALRKMPEIIKGAGGYTYKYTNPQEAYDLKFPEYKGKSFKPAVYVYDKLEVKGPNSKTFTTVDRNTPEYKSIMKEIGDKIKYKDAPDKLPIIPGVDTSPPPEPYKFAKMKRRSDGSMAKLKDQSFMKRMKMMNEASSPVMKNGLTQKDPEILKKNDKGGTGFGLPGDDITKHILDNIKIGKGTITGTSGVDTVKPIINKLKNLITKPGYGPGGKFPNPGTISDDLSDKITKRTINKNKNKNNTGGSTIGAITGTIGGILSKPVAPKLTRLGVSGSITKIGNKISDLFGK